MKKRNTCSGQYYPICNPFERNENTGNFVVDTKYILANDKDFLFEWKNPNTGKVETKILSKEYVKANLKSIPKWLEDKLLGKKRITYMFYMISYKAIQNY